MKAKRWIPKGYDLNDGNIVRSFLASGDEWQIFDSYDGSKFLVTLPCLSNKWVEKGILEGTLFESFAFEEKLFSLFRSRKEFILAPLEEGDSLQNKLDGIAFSLALKKSRAIDQKSSFHDALYVEQYSRILPTWTMTPRLEDDVVLGKWLTGGVEISVSSFRRLSALTGWMPSDDLAQIVEAAGFEVPGDAAILRKQHAKGNGRTTEVVNGKNEQNVTLEGKKTFSLPGRPQLEDFFNEHVIDVVFNSEKYRKLGIGFPSAIVLHGPPGCGKTFAVQRLVEFLDWPSFSIDSQSVGSPYIHQTSKKISEVFEKAIEEAPSVLIIDEMESFLSERGGSGASGLYHIEEVAEFLRRIPEAGNNRVLVMAMTNMIDKIDPAILRRGRFDHVIEVGMPSREEVTPLLFSLLKKLPISEDLDVDNAIEKLTGSPLSDIAFLVREAARIAAKSGKSNIDQESLDAALERISNSTGQKTTRIGF